MCQVSSSARNHPHPNPLPGGEGTRRIPRFRRLIALTLLAGCAAHPAKPPVAAKPTTRPAPTEFTLTMHPPHAADPRDPQPPWEALVHLKVYQISLPLGTISTNAAFWKRLDEDFLPTTVVANLNENGLRCGIAPKTQWHYFRDLLQQESTKVRTIDLDGLHATAVPLELDKPIHSEDIFVRSARGLEGKTYDDCTNQVTLSFGPVPRTPWAIRLALCPTIKAQFTAERFTPVNRELQSKYEATDHLFDLGLEADVDDDRFVVFSPNAAAVHPTTIGNRFLVDDAAPEQREQIIVIVPSFLRIDGKPMTLADTLVSTHR